MFADVHQVGLATIIYSYNATICKNLYLIATFRSPVAAETNKSAITDHVAKEMSLIAPVPSS